MKEKLTREERRAAYAALSSKEKIQHDGNKLLRLLDVVRKILFVFAIISFVVGAVFLVTSACHKSMELQEKTGIVELEKGQGGVHLISLLDEGDFVLEENTPEGWDILFLKIGITCVVYGVFIIIVMMIVRFLKVIFSQVMNAETPFSEKSKVPLRKIFVLLSIVIFFKNQILGLVCGFVFLYIYRLFAYGCELQVESDETL